MAKDGTNRGEARVGAGRKPKSLSDKILDGQFGVPAIEANFDGTFEPPPPKDYLTAEQKDGSQLYSKQIYQETYRWLKSVGCEKIVAKQLVEDYALAKSRHIQCENILSKFGLLAKHPTTGEPTRSPFISMSIDYNKQAMQIWSQIYSIVKENNAKGQVGLTVQSATMDRLLRRVK